MKVSIIIPTLNEAQDIGGTLEAVLAMPYPDKEVIVVDDSTDRTREIVRQYVDQGVQLIYPGGGGRCEARNLGIRLASGEVVIILNADVRPHPDFLERLLPHYRNGADYVLVSYSVSNREHGLARYLDAIDQAMWESPAGIQWSEGFSCRREVALQAGLFPTGFSVPICAGEDVHFGAGLLRFGARRVYDRAIRVEHVVPIAIPDYWSMRVGRGQGAAQCHRFLHGWSYGKLSAWQALKTLRTAFYLLTVLPVLARCWQLSRHSEKGRGDIIAFCYAWLIDNVAFHVGEWRALLELMSKDRGVALASAPQAEQ